MLGRLRPSELTSREAVSRTILVLGRGRLATRLSKDVIDPECCWTGTHSSLNASIRGYPGAETHPSLGLCCPRTPSFMKLFTQTVALGRQSVSRCQPEVR